MIRKDACESNAEIVDIGGEYNFLDIIIFNLILIYYIILYFISCCQFFYLYWFYIRE
jgi:hypothetical protein